MNCTSKASPNSTPACRRICAALTRASLRPQPIEHLRELGVTAVELLPVHYHIDEHFLAQRGRVNYWGYNTLGFLAPDPRYAASGPEGAVQEFQAMVRAAARRRHRGHSRRRLQPHRRRRRARSHAFAPRHRQRRLLPARRRPRALRRFHRLRQFAQRRPPAHAPAHHGFAAALGARRCTSMVFASISPARSRANCGKSIGSARSSTSSIRTRCFPR